MKTSEITPCLNNTGEDEREQADVGMDKEQVGMDKEQVGMDKEQVGIGGMMRMREELVVWFSYAESEAVVCHRDCTLRKVVVCQSGRALRKVVVC